MYLQPCCRVHELWIRQPSSETTSVGFSLPTNFGGRSGSSFSRDGSAKSFITASYTALQAVSYTAFTGPGK